MTAELHLAETAHRPFDFEVGTVQGVSSLSPEELSLPDGAVPAQVVHASVYDPSVAYLEAINPGRVAQIQKLEKRMNGASRLLYPLWRNRERTIAYDQDSAVALQSIEGAAETVANGDRASRDKFFNDPNFLGDDALRAWQKNIPHATALVPLANPFNTPTVQDRNGNEVAATPKTQEWMTACTDGWDIRNRTAVMVNEMSHFVGAYAEARPDEKVSVMSVAGGTALPTMQAIMRSGVDQSRVQLVLVESDARAAASAFELAERVGFQGEIIHKNVNVFDPREMAALHQELQTEGVKVAALDAVGIAEYSSEEHRKPEYEQRFGKDYMLYNPDKFLEACLKFVDKDGMAVIGQMLSTRQNPHFTRGVVGWPRICMRTAGRFAELLKDGGADMNLTRLVVTPLKTYAMAVVHKSEVAAAMGNLVPNISASENRLSANGVRHGVQMRRTGIAASILAATTLISPTS